MTESHDINTAPLREIPTPKTSIKLTLLQLLGAIVALGFVGALMLPATRTAREPARRSQCKNNLKQIGLALHNYADTYGSLPPACTYDAQYRPLHSWRTLILPYMDQQALYQKIDLTKPWDDPANKLAYDTVIQAYRCPSEANLDGPKTHTTYMAIVGSSACFLPTTGRKLSEITDDKASTLMVVEVESKQATHWMSPIDTGEYEILNIGPKSKTSHAGGFHALLVNGTIRFISSSLKAEQRKALISIAGNEKLGER